MSKFVDQDDSSTLVDSTCTDSLCLSDIKIDDNVANNSSLGISFQPIRSEVKSNDNDNISIQNQDLFEADKCNIASTDSSSKTTEFMIENFANSSLNKAHYLAEITDPNSFNRSCSSKLADALHFNHRKLEDATRKLLMDKKNVSTIQNSVLKELPEYLHKYSVQKENMKESGSVSQIDEIIPLVNSEIERRTNKSNDSLNTISNRCDITPNFDEILSEFDRFTNIYADQIKQKHERQFDNFEEKWRTTKVDKYYKPSAEVLRLQKVQNRLVSSKQFSRAKAIEKEMKLILREDYFRAELQHAKDYEIAKNNLINKHKRELEVFYIERQTKRTLIENQERVFNSGFSARSAKDSSANSRKSLKCNFDYRKFNTRSHRYSTSTSRKSSSSEKSAREVTQGTRNKIINVKSSKEPGYLCSSVWGHGVDLNNKMFSMKGELKKKFVFYKDTIKDPYEVRVPRFIRERDRKAREQALNEDKEGLQLSASNENYCSASGPSTKAPSGSRESYTQDLTEECPELENAEHSNTANSEKEQVESGDTFKIKENDIPTSASEKDINNCLEKAPGWRSVKMSPNETCVDDSEMNTYTSTEVFINQSNRSESSENCDENGQAAFLVENQDEINEGDLTDIEKNILRIREKMGKSQKDSISNGPSGNRSSAFVSSDEIDPVSEDKARRVNGTKQDITNEKITELDKLKSQKKHEGSSSRFRSVAFSSNNNTSKILSKTKKNYESELATDSKSLEWTQKNSRYRQYEKGMFRDTVAAVFKEVNGSQSTNV